MTDSLLTDTVGEIFTAVCTDDALRAAERDGFAPDAWAAVAEAGLPWISVPEEAGGEGGDLADALAVLRLAGYHGLPLPIAENGGLARWVPAACPQPGCERPGALVFAVFAPAAVRVEPHVNLAGEPRDTVYFDGAAPLAS